MKRITAVLSLSLCFSLLLYGFVFASNGEDSANSESPVAARDVNDGEFGETESYVDAHGGLVEMTNITTMGTDQVLWSQHYHNEYSVKKDIFIKNYTPNGSAGRVNVYIKNTGNRTIKINIYQSVWNSKTIASGKIAPGRDRVFVVGPEYGKKDCLEKTCYAYHQFTVSAYADSGKISFYGKAKVYY